MLGLMCALLLLSSAHICAASRNPLSNANRQLGAALGDEQRKHGSVGLDSAPFADSWSLASALSGTDAWALGDLGTIMARLQPAAAPWPASGSGVVERSAAGGASAPRLGASPHFGGSSTSSSSSSDAPAPANWGDAEPAALPGGAPAAPHKPLWPLSDRDLLMLALAAAALVLAAGGGIGGGAIYMPLYVVAGGFASSNAVALSNLTILGGAAANFVINVQKAHPRVPGRPLIDWTLILIMEPTTILGALLGSYANKVRAGADALAVMAAIAAAAPCDLLTLPLTRPPPCPHPLHPAAPAEHRHRHAADCAADAADPPAAVARRAHVPGREPGAARGGCAGGGCSGAARRDRRRRRR